jgi:hyaluronate lyase
MARAVHRRPGFAFGISMSFTLIKPYESINGENLHGWHTGDGMTYLYKAPPSSLSQYANAYWPTVDPYRLPGTTVEALTLADGVALTTTTHWAGGATVNGLGAIAMSLAAPKTTLTARKAWFCIGDAVVCLGTNITASDGLDIETTVDNRNVVAVHRRHRGLRLPRRRHAQRPARGPDRQLGRHQLLAHRRRGRIHPPLRHPLARPRHRARRRDVRLHRAPGGRRVRDRRVRREPGDHRRRQHPAVQAVTDSASGVDMALVMQCGAPMAAGIQVDKTAAVITQVVDGVLTVAVADPTAQLTGTINVTIEGVVSAMQSADSG